MRNCSLRWWEVAVAGFSAGALACSTEPRVEPPTTAIYYQCYPPPTGPNGICRIAPDGTHLLQLAPTAGYGSESAPTVTPDGLWLAYGCAGPTYREAICTMDPGGGHSRLVIDDAPSLDPSWSPDGRLAYSRLGEIWTVDSSGSNETQLTHSGGTLFNPQWSPDGTKILAATDEYSTGVGGVWIMNQDGSNLHVMFDLAGAESRPRWSHDGTKLAFTWSNPATGFHDLFLYDIATSTSTQLTHLNSVDEINWSPDDREVVFRAQFEEGRTELFTMGVDGSRSTNITSLNQSESVAGAVWAPLPAAYR